MAWVEIKKKSSKQIHLVTEEAFKQIFKPQGFEIVNKTENIASTAQNTEVQTNTQPKQELPPKRQYTKRNSVSNNK